MKITLREARKVYKTSRAGLGGQRFDPKFIKAYTLFMAIEKLIGWKSMVYFFLKYQRCEHPERGYKLKDALLPCCTRRSIKDLPRDSVN